MKFIKMQGCGNDYVYVDGSTVDIKNKAEVVRWLSNRNFGIGGDGVIFINRSSIADFEMEMWNADGTRSQMCGNGIRCVAKFVYDQGLTQKNPVKIESFGAVKELHLTVEDGKVSRVRVNMGEPELIASRVPVVSENKQVIDEAITVDQTQYRMTCVSMGNPHAVVFVGEEGMPDLMTVGPAFENHERFPERTNTEFIRVLNDHEVFMRVWERGTGETLACGTGACASVVACVLNGKTGRKVTVHLLGGDLEIEWKEEDNRVYMTGPAVTVFEGEIDVSQIDKVPGEFLKEK